MFSKWFSKNNAATAGLNDGPDRPLHFNFDPTPPVSPNAAFDPERDVGSADETDSALPERFDDADFAPLPEDSAPLPPEAFIPDAPAVEQAGLTVEGVWKFLGAPPPDWVAPAPADGHLYGQTHGYSNAESTQTPSAKKGIFRRGLSWTHGLGRSGGARVLLRDIDLVVRPGRTLGIVGVSGSGKSTLARLIMGLDAPDAGRVLFDGQDLHAMDAQSLRLARRNFQMIFQDPRSSLNPRMNVGAIVAEPLQALMPELSWGQQRGRVAEALEHVGLRASAAARFVHELSGGQRQRVAIARAIVTRPRLIVADEPVSALDVSVQAQVLNLLLRLQQQLGMSYVLISHDLAVVNHMCDEVVVLHDGQIVEHGTPRQIATAASDSHTRALVAAASRIDPGAARRRRTERLLAQLQQQPPAV